MTSTRWALPLLLAVATSCTHARSKAERASAGTGGATAAAPDAATAPRACRDDDGCGPGELCVDARCIAIAPGMPECRGVTAHFGFDRADLGDDQLPALRRTARCLRADPSQEVLVAGNCDERGTTQYNVALGFRRADSVDRYLRDLGVDAARLKTVSYGKEQPVCTEESEECWARNRRADVSWAGSGAHGAAAPR